ncbi:hypothetical protein KJY77_02215 [Canibacter sp. lx-72]|uniref:hypothetical protein n=1 Tax=Canibacter zhuwentaonis TaxID=2837491 RepID=UPI001BDBBD39|nr:hypothetical protein [Canibacter zhuwentaonis]MBT1017958.1 hypothetical protein [Canibacter zhuwentaonis]MBT1035118.1 hypothetical protein [Canibacter zhuwentaonis]
MTENTTEKSGSWRVTEQTVPQKDPLKNTPAVALDTTVASAPEEAAAGTPGQMRSFEVMLSGVFGGVFMLYSWAWVVIVAGYSQLNQLTSQTAGVVGSFLQLVLYGMAAVATPLWFLSAFLCWGRNKRKLFFIVLAVGLVVLAPLPLFFKGGV